MKRLFRRSMALIIALCGLILSSRAIGQFVQWPLRFTGRQALPTTTPYDGAFLAEVDGLRMLSYSFSRATDAIVEGHALYTIPHCTNCSPLTLRITLFNSTDNAVAAYNRQVTPTRTTYKRFIFLSTQPAYDLIMSDVSENTLYYVNGRWLIQIRTSSAHDLLAFFDALPY